MEYKKHIYNYRRLFEAALVCNLLGNLGIMLDNNTFLYFASLPAIMAFICLAAVLYTDKTTILKGWKKSLVVLFSISVLLVYVYTFYVFIIL